MFSGGMERDQAYELVKELFRLPFANFDFLQLFCFILKTWNYYSMNKVMYMHYPKNTIGPYLIKMLLREGWDKVY